MPCSIAIVCALVLSIASVQSAPMPVYIAWHIESLFNLDITGSTYTSKIEASVAFQPNAALSAIPSNPLINYLELQQLPIWVVMEPLNSISFVAMTDIARWSATPPTYLPPTVLFNASAPWIIRQLRWLTTNSDSAQLETFPFDSHTCTTSLAIKYPNQTFAQFVMIPRDTSPGYLDNAWVATSNKTFLDTYVDPVTGEVYSSVTNQVGISRRTAFYRGKIVTVMCVLVCMGWLLFFLDMTDASRVLSTSTIFLVLVTFNLSTQDSLPRVSYLTRLDSFTLMCLINTFFVFIIFNFQYLMESLISQRKAKIEDYEDALEKEKGKQQSAAAAAAVGSTEPHYERPAVRRQQWALLGPFSRQREVRINDDPLHVTVQTTVDGTTTTTTTPRAAPVMTSWMIFWASHRHRINITFFTVAVVPFVVIAPVIIYSV